jgi:hypothetical protein
MIGTGMTMNGPVRIEINRRADNGAQDEGNDVREAP